MCFTLKRRERIHIFIYSLMFFCICCSNKHEAPDVSDIDAPVIIHRIDQMLNQDSPGQTRRFIKDLHKNHPYFSDVYFNKILPLPKPLDTTQATEKWWLDFFMNEDVRALADSIQSQYPDDQYLTLLWEPLFKYWKFYFPEKKVPEIYTFYSLLNYGLVELGDNKIGVGLDFFLGSEFEAYHPSLFPAYISKSMAPEYLSTRLATAMIQSEMAALQTHRLIDEIIQGGKQFYILEKLLPHATDSIIFPYPNEKIKWMRQNELETWAMILREEWLYDQNVAKWAKLVHPSPSGPSQMPQESPGEAGIWIGREIVRQYMVRHPEIELSDLLKATDAQKILEDSKYKPRKS